jgi:hypothetical protein
MRYFVVCTSEVDHAPYVLSEVSEIAESDRATSISGGIAGICSVVMTREDMDADSDTRSALHAWDMGDETSFDRETAALDRRKEVGLGRLHVVPYDEAPPAVVKRLARRRDLDARVARSHVVRLDAMQTRAQCLLVCEAAVK